MLIGTHLGPYEVLAKLGEGGMGEVYRARDTRLNRHIAIKVLPDLFANDPERLARFHREAQVLASLNHPNIAHIHGFEDSGDVHALVMELVDGPTLAERIAREPIPLAEALAIAKQIGEALAAAHDQGIVHRDLKPANVKVREDGMVKVLDFGLARLVLPETSGVGASAVSQSPTLTTPAMTQAGVILGTAAYMSPEQAKGRTADKRSDVWAFGAVLYEMLTGRRPFEGEDLSDTLANVLKSEPDWAALPADVPPQIRALIQRCLAKDPRLRVADISTALYVLSEGAGLAGPVVNQQPARVPLWRRIAIPAAAAIAAGVAVGAALWPARPADAPRVTRFALTPTGAETLQVDAQSRDLTITPDGASIVYRGGAGGSRTQLFVRALGQIEAVPLTIPSAPRGPFASPDGQWIGFVEPSPVTLNKVAITGGPVLRICAFDGAGRGISWGDDNSIVFATASTSTGLQRVPSAGGDPVVLTKPNREIGESDHVYPRLFPGSQTVLFTITMTTGGIDASQVAVLDLRTNTQKIVMRGGSQALYLPSGHLVYVAAGSLRAVKFDLERLEVIGTAVPIVSKVMILPTGAAEFDVARDGTLVYVTAGAEAASQRTLVWVDRQGRQEPIKSAPARPYLFPRLSPDGRRIAFDIRDQGNDIWVWDIDRETLTRVTSDPGVDESPAWTPDGRRLVFTSQADGSAGSLFWQVADGSGVAERLTSSPRVQRLSAVLADGKRILFHEAGTTTATDIMMLTLDDRRVEPVLQTPQAELQGTVSPDGRWLAYEANDSGQLQVFVRPFPNVNEAKIQVSTDDGSEPVWARNGQELFYQSPTGALMSVPVGRGTAWTAGTPSKLFDGPYFRGTTGITATRTYDVSPDGKRFLMIKPSAAGQDSTPTIVVVQNWFEELKRLVPTTR
jgi:eukaryotic-like serine/threonine-protein kinase